MHETETHDEWAEAAEHGRRGSTIPEEPSIHLCTCPGCFADVVSVDPDAMCETCTDYGCGTDAAQAREVCLWVVGEGRR